MVMPTEDDIKNALKAVKYPGFSRDIVSFGLIKGISAGNGVQQRAVQERQEAEYRATTRLDAKPSS